MFDHGALPRTLLDIHSPPVVATIAVVPLSAIATLLAIYPARPAAFVAPVQFRPSFKLIQIFDPVTLSLADAMIISPFEDIATEFQV
jgi:hypothetical protein